MESKSLYSVLKKSIEKFRGVITDIKGMENCFRTGITNHVLGEKIKTQIVLKSVTSSGIKEPILIIRKTLIWCKAGLQCIAFQRQKLQLLQRYISHEVDRVRRTRCLAFMLSGSQSLEFLFLEPSEIVFYQTARYTGRSDSIDHCCFSKRPPQTMPKCTILTSWQIDYLQITH